MAEFMVDVNLNGFHTDEFMELIPEQRTMVNDMMFEGKITSYCLSMDRTKLWLIMIGKNEEDILDMLSSFPLINFMDCEVSPLMFHNSARQVFSHISLN